MRIYRKVVKTLHPDTYRKHYWSNDTHLEPIGENDVGVYYFNKPPHNDPFNNCADDELDIGLVYCTSGIKSHTDFEAMSWLLVLHNECYKFEFQRNLYNISSGDLIHFNLMMEHGLVKHKSGRNLFLALSLDYPYYTRTNVDKVINLITSHTKIKRAK
jgi:hypothetical protein